MAKENELSIEYAVASTGLSATACNNTLDALGVLANDASVAEAMARIHHLGQYSRRITEALEIGEDAYQRDDADTANLEWASALVLMDAMSVEAANIADNDVVKYAADLQKSGKTA